MSEKFTGLCIGGPKDGQSAEYDRPYFSTPHMMQFDIGVMQRGLEGLMTSTLSVTRYIHFFMPMRRKENGGIERIGFWLAEGVHPDDIFDRLIDGYRRPIVVERF
jgi:hypothetical protein